MSYSFHSDPHVDQDQSNTDDSSYLLYGLISAVVVFQVVICGWFCIRRCLCQMCCKPRPLIGTVTYTAVVTSTPQQYPQQPLPMYASPQQYPREQYQSIPVQPGHPAQPSAYHDQPYGAGPPPTYQEAVGPLYPSQPPPYSQVAFGPGHPPYPI